MNIGVFTLGLILVVFGFVSDIANYYDTYSLFLIIAGFVLLIIGAAIPSVTTMVEKKETVVPERRKTVTIDES